VIHTPPPDHGRGSLQFGVGYFDDLEGGADYQVSARHQLLPANRRGGEWENVLQLGSISLASSEFYQPLDAGMRWFVAPRIEFRRELLDLYLESRPVAEYRLDTAEARLAAGRVFGRWGELRAAAFLTDVYADPRIGDPRFPPADELRSGLELRFRVDTVDDVAFPRSGSEVEVVYTVSSSTLGSEADFERVWGSAAHSWSFGELTVTPHLEYGENLEQTFDVIDLYPLGGLFRLSGLGRNELLGQRVALARVLGYWRLLGIQFAGLGVRLYAGTSFEAGNVYSGDSPLTADSLRYGGSVWVGASTPLGPALLGWGLSEGGRDRFYILIGDRF
jgi:NTE family protein